MIVPQRAAKKSQRLELTHPGHPQGTEKNNPRNASYRGRSTRDPGAGGNKACTNFHSSRPRRRKAKPCIMKPPALPNFWQERGTATSLHTSEGSAPQLCPHGAQTCRSQQTPTRTARSSSRPLAPGPPFHACPFPHRFAETMQACGATPEGEAGGCPSFPLALPRTCEVLRVTPSTRSCHCTAVRAAPVYKPVLVGPYLHPQTTQRSAKISSHSQLRRAANTYGKAPCKLRQD